MNKKTFSAFLALSLVVGVLSLISTTNVSGQAGEEPTTSTTITNTAPTFTPVDVSDDSSSASPTDVGDTVTFTVTATDPNGDNYYLIICETDSVAAGNATYPTCPGGDLIDGTPSSTTSGSQATETYVAQAGDPESNPWYAFVCDGNGTGTADQCSSSSQGTGGVSPFNVNHAATYTATDLVILADGDTVSDTYSVTGNGIVLTSAATGASAYALGLNLVLIDGATDCVAEGPSATLGGLIAGTSPNYTLDCDLDDSGDVGTNPVTGGRLTAAIEILSTTGTIHEYMHAAAEGTGSDTMPAGTSTLSDLQAIEPGETLGFVLPAASLTDGDSDGSQDTVKMHICSGESVADGFDGVTTAFVGSSDSCTGGTLLCSSSVVDPTGSTAAYCVDTLDSIPVPTSHASNYTIMVYVDDVHDFEGVPAVSATEDQDYTVADVAPVLGSYTTGTVGLNAGDDDWVLHTVLYTDDNGDRDTTIIDMLFYEDDALAYTACDTGAEEDDNNCYNIIDTTTTSLNTTPLADPAEGCYIDSVNPMSSAGTGRELTGGDASITIKCAYNIWFNADCGASCSTTGTSTDNWKLKVIATDGLGDEIFIDSSAVAVGALQALDLKTGETTISYGTLSPGETMAAAADIQTTVENAGNIELDILLTGSDMCSTWTTPYTICGEYSIARAKQHWAYTDATAYASGYALVQTASTDEPNDISLNGCLNRNMAVRTANNSTAEDRAIQWLLSVPAAQEKGSYTGQNTYTSALSDTCDGEGPF